MAERVDRFVEWAAEAECYVMVEVRYGGPSASPKRFLSPPLGERELTYRLHDAGMAAAEIAELLADARARAEADRVERADAREAAAAVDVAVPAARVRGG